MKKLTDHVYGLLTMGNFMNTCVIDNNGSLTVVDTMMNAGFVDRLVAGLQQIGKTLDDVQHIFITHCHYDHVGGLAALQAQCNARTLAHRLDAPIIRGEQPVIYADPSDLGFFSRQLRKTLSNTADPARVDVELNGDETLDAILPDAKVIHLPGHTYGQIGLYLPEEGTLIGGDVMMRLPWGLSIPFRVATPEIQTARESIKKVAQMDLNNLILGHGTPLMGNAAATIKPFAARLPG